MMADRTTQMLAEGLQPAVREALLALLGGDASVLAAFLDALAKQGSDGAPFISPRETRIGLRRARELCASGKVKAFRVAGRWLIDRDDFVRWVREQGEASIDTDESSLEKRLATRGVRIRRAG